MVLSSSKCPWRRVEKLSLGDISSWHITLTFPFESWDGWLSLSPPPQTGDIVCRDRIQREGRVYSPSLLFCSPHDSAQVTRALDGVGGKQDLEGNFSSFFSSLLVSCSLQQYGTATFCFKLNFFSFFSQPTISLVKKRKVKLSPSSMLKCRMWWRKCLLTKIIYKKIEIPIIITINDTGLRTLLAMRQFWRKKSHIVLIGHYRFLSRDSGKNKPTHAYTGNVETVHRKVLILESNLKSCYEGTSW